MQVSVAEETPITKILEVVKRLDAWLGKNGWAGYDPYDIKELPWVIKITKLGNDHFLFELVREILFELFYSFPEVSRKILRVQRSVNAKGIGLLAKAYLQLYQISNEKNFLDKSTECLRWLEANDSKGYSGTCWGYPFNWQAKKLIPRETPSGVVTATVGDAFWSFYQHRKEQKYLDVCRSICEFFINNLNIDQIDRDRICFSYTPITNDHVHNANLFVAEFLIKVGSEIDDRRYVDYGIKAMRYTLSYQNPDGSFFYSGPPDEVKNWVDHYHTGFVLRSLYSIYQITNDQSLLPKLKECYNHYLANFFLNDGIPKFQPQRIYPVEIHSCAEAILCLSELSDTFPQGMEMAHKVVNYTLNHLRNSEGYFYHAVRKSRFLLLTYVAKIPYLRWGQAWMLRALANFLVFIHKTESYESDGVGDNLMIKRQ